MADPGSVREMRLVVTADDFEAAVRFYRDELGLPERASYSSADGRVVILEAGRATLEIADPAQAAFIDQVEVGRRVAGHIRAPVDCQATKSARAGRRAALGQDPSTGRRQDRSSTSIRRLQAGIVDWQATGRATDAPRHRRAAPPTGSDPGPTRATLRRCPRVPVAR
jgi:catechol 2,3-dioxygenase-like lactoylglutathione lyase family enzyme